MHPHLLQATSGNARLQPAQQLLHAMVPLPQPLRPPPGSQRPSACRVPGCQQPLVNTYNQVALRTRAGCGPGLAWQAGSLRAARSLPRPRPQGGGARAALPSSHQPLPPTAMQRNRVCAFHYRADAFPMEGDGAPWRFCQQVSAAVPRASPTAMCPLLCWACTAAGPRPPLLRSPVHKPPAPQCAKPHPLTMFDEGRRSCRDSLVRHKKRRRDPGAGRGRGAPGAMR